SSSSAMAGVPSSTTNGSSVVNTISASDVVAALAIARTKKDILEDPYDELHENIRVHLKNLRELEDKIYDLQKAAKGGRRLNAAETVECSKFSDVQNEIRRNNELMEMIRSSRKEYLTRRAEAFLTKDGFHVGVQYIRRLLHSREVVTHAARYMKKREERKEDDGMPVLDDDQHAKLEELNRLLNLTSEGCVDKPHYLKILNDTAMQLQGIMEDKPKAEEDPRRTLLNTIITSEYYENMRQNDVEEESTVEDEEEEEEDKQEEKPEQERKMKAEDPPVTFLKSSDASASSSRPVPFFGYDDSLPHPNQIFFNGTQLTHMLQPSPGSLMHPPPPPMMMTGGPHQMHPMPPPGALVMGPPPHLAHLHMQPMQPMMQQGPPMPPMGPPPMGPPMGQIIPMGPTPLMQQQLPVNFRPHGSNGLNAQAPAWEPPAIPAGAGTGAGNQQAVMTSPNGSKDGSGGSGTHNGPPMRGRGGQQRNYEPRRHQQVVGNFNQYAPPLATFNPPPFGVQMFPANNRGQYQNNGYRGGYSGPQRFSVNGLTNNLSALSVSNPPPNGPNPPSTSNNSNGVPFRRSYRPATSSSHSTRGGRGGNHNGAQNNNQH
ncbi:hypothetical protein PRIPAC_96408, partial [Pristionchus pacificus]